MTSHIPVLLNEVLDFVLGDSEGTYLDATFGMGGHSRALLEGLGKEATLIVSDRDSQAIAKAQLLAAKDKRVKTVTARFSELASALSSYQETISGVLFDLGVSSPQLDLPERGFSFQTDGPLDMRMDQSKGETAAHWLSRAAETEISDILWELGEERFSRRIARKIVQQRTIKPITSTTQLAQIISSVVHRRGRRLHPATKTFQAIRMHVNNEIQELEAALEVSTKLIAPNGRIAIISFHSLEDRIVKRRFRNLVKDSSNRVEATKFRVLTKKPSVVSQKELTTNPRSRSARLRVLECLG